MRWIILGLIVVLLVNTHSDALASQPELSTHTALIAALQQGSIDSAIQLIKTITKPQPDDLQPLSMGVRLMLDHLYIVDVSDLTMPSVKAKMDEALHTAELAILADPAALDGWCAKALALNWAYRSQEALSLIVSIRLKYPDSPTPMVVQAEIETDLRQYAEAQNLLDQAVMLIEKKTPINKALRARAFYISGNIEQILGHTDQAIAAYEAAWAIASAPYDPSDPWMVVPPGYILYQLGPMYLFKNQAAAALERYTQAMKIDKQDPFLYYLRGRVYRYNGRTQEAIAEFQACSAMAAQQWRCARNLGQIAFTQSDWNNVVHFFQPIISDNSQISDDYYFLGMAYAKLSKCKIAVPIIQKGAVLVKQATGHPYWNDTNFATLAKLCPKVQ